jgi:hypothetical protein
LSIGGARCCALTAKARVLVTLGPSPSPTRAFYVVDGVERDNEEIRTDRSDFVRLQRPAVIGDSGRKAAMPPRIP